MPTWFRFRFIPFDFLQKEEILGVEYFQKMLHRLDDFKGEVYISGSAYKIVFGGKLFSFLFLSLVSTLGLW